MPELPDPEDHEFFEAEPEPEPARIEDSDVVVRIFREDEE